MPFVSWLVLRKESKLAKVFVASLVSDVLLNDPFVALARYCADVVAVGPKLSAPELFFYGRDEFENVAACL